MPMVVMEPDPEWLAQRAAWGTDKRDEVWDGVLHVPPAPSASHQLLGRDLLFALRPHVLRLGLDISYELAVFDPEKGLNNYRQPDLVITAPSDLSERGVEGHAEVAVEILSPNDESRQKFGFYAARRIPEYWLIEPKTRQIEVYVLRGDVYFAVADRNGTIHAPRLGLEFRVVEGPRLRITWADGADGSVDV